MRKKFTTKNSPFLKDDYTEESLSDGWDIIKDIAIKKYGLSFYEPNMEIVSFEDMLQIYAGSLPITYDHWSFGKSYQDLYKKYLNNRMGVAYEVIFNTSPALCYLLEHNSPTMQGLVQAHAAIGHSSFFKNNVFFKEMTNAKTIIPFLKNSKAFISECEQKYGEKSVEKILDVCHSLSLYAIDRKPIFSKTNKEREKIRLRRLLEKEQDYDLKLETIKLKEEIKEESKPKRLREENILKFIGKFSPSLKSWERQIIEIYCKIQQYLYPQMLTKLSNEGFASFWHHTIMNDLVDMKLIDASGALEFLHSHCSVLRQPEFDDRGYYGFNPYKLGFEIYKDIRRICESPTEEDKKWFPGLIGKNWIEEVKFAAYNFKDESFVLQYLSPKVIRDLKLFTVENDANEKFFEVNNIHDDDGYNEIRKKLANHYNIMNRIPDLYVEGWDVRKNRSLYLCFQEKNGIKIDTGGRSSNVMELIKLLWPFPIVFKYFDSEGNVEEFRG